jgi:perosamine synthetase
MSEARRLANEITNAIREIFGSGQIPLHAPTFTGNEWDYLKDCLDSTFVSSVGKFVEQFEQQLVDFTGAKYAVSVVNGTAALQIALILAGVEADDEVLLSPLTFVATANAISYCNAVPHFVESDPTTMGIDPIKLHEYLSSVTSQVSGKCVNNKTGRRIRALVPMHTFGHPSELESLLLVANEFNLVLVEDAAESLGSYRNKKHTGTFGLLGTLSFNGNKTITTGGGGAILTNDENLAKRAKHLTTTAKLPHLWEYKHDEVGYNFRMPNLNAALGCAQLEQLPRKLKSKRDLFERYQKAFSDIRGLTLFSEPKNSQSNYWLQTLLLDENQCEYRDHILDATNKAGITTRPAWQLMHTLEPYKMSPRMNLQVAVSLSKRIINIPSNLGLV